MPAKTPTSSCTRCGAEIPGDAPRDLCPRCLIEAVLSAPDDFVEEEAETDDITLGTTTLPSVPDHRLKEQIGIGGFGEVYAADQLHPVRRQVAIKVLKQGQNTKQIIRRFEAERQALALMDHPNIATIYNAGETEDKRPYVSMELIKGPPVTTFCDREEYTIRERIELLIDICEAVQHAHQKGVIHRDLKPSNILVARDPSKKAIPSVIDFGVAKAVDEPLINQTLFTAVHQMMGTPAYMSPEQTENRIGQVDTRSDIYALGVILFELLTGGVPFPASKEDSNLENWMRRIRENEADPPSNRLESLPHGPLQSRIREIRGDLDWITLKALEKDPDRRYQSAQALADDLRRHLDHEPVVAGPPSQWYRFGKLVRRHRVATAFTAALVAAILAGLLGTTMMFLSAEAARDELSLSYSRSDLLAADQLASRDQSGQAVAVLCRALRTAPDNEIAKTYLLSLLSNGVFFRETPQLQVDPRIKRVEVLKTSRAGDVVVVAGRDAEDNWLVQRQNQVWELKADAMVRAFDLNPDGSWIAVGWDDGKVATYAENQKIAEIQVGDGIVRNVRILPDSKRVAIEFDGKIQIWNLESGEIDHVLDPGDLILSTAVSGDGSVIAVGTRDGRVVAWNPETGEFAGRVIWGSNPVEEISLSFDGKMAAIGSGSRLAQVWRLSESLPRSQPMHHPAAVTSVVLSPDETRVVTGCADGSRRVWNSQSGRLMLQDTPLAESVNWVGVEPAGRVITASMGGQIRTGSLNSIRTTSLGQRGQSGLVAINDQRTRLLVWIPSLHAVCSWRIGVNATPTKAVLTAQSETPVRALWLSPEGRQLLTPTREGVLRWLNPQTDEPLAHPIEGLGNPIDLNWESVLSESGQVHRLDNPKKPWQVTESEIRIGALGGTKGNVAAVTQEDKLLVGNVNERNVRELDSEIDKAARVYALAWSPSERQLAVAHGTEGVSIVDPKSGEILTSLPHPVPVRALSFTEDGKSLITGAASGAVQLWDLADRSAVWSRSLTHSIACIAVSSDGKRVVAGSTRGAVRFLDRESGLPLGPPIDLGQDLLSAGIDETGEVAVFGFKSGAVRWLRFPASGELMNAEFLDFARDFGGWAMDESGALERLPPNPVEAELTSNLRDWLLSDPGLRGVIPGDAQSTNDYAQQLLNGKLDRNIREGKRLRVWK